MNCTGPFELKSWQSGEKINLTRFDGYWDKKLTAKAKEVEFVIQTDPVARVNALKSGEIDGGWMLPSNAIGELKASGAGRCLLRTELRREQPGRLQPRGPAGKPGGPQGVVDGH